MLPLNKLLIHPKTRAALESFLTQDTHALLLEAPKGAGKHTVLEAMLIATQTDRSENHLILDEASLSIGIDEVRLIREKLKLKSYDDQKTAIVIHDAERMTREAQNSLLKLLEEPPKDTLFLLSTSDMSKLLSTVRSRVVLVTIMKPKKSDVATYLLDKGYADKDIQSALAVSNGMIGYATSILSNSNPAITQAIADAKEILGLSVADKLSRVESLTKQKESLPTLLYGLERILHSGLHSSAAAGKDLHSWQQKLNSIIEAETGLQNNVSTRLVLTKLMLSL